MSFSEHLSRADLPALRRRLDSVSRGEVVSALARDRADFSDFLALLSPAAASFLEPMARRAREITIRRFGRTILLYAPLYLSNECTNDCRYCGFRKSTGGKRLVLDDDRINGEAGHLMGSGFRHVLLVTGESPRSFSVSRLCEVIRRLTPSFPSLSIEVQALTLEEYRATVDAGAEGLTIYQETYDPEIYASVHPCGPKRDFGFRLAAPERAGDAGMRRLGIGALLGLCDFRYEGIAMALHAGYLMKRCWRSNVSVSVPRLRSTPDGFGIPCPVNDAEMAQLMFALRIHLPDAGIVLSTREGKELRDGLMRVCVTQMSAGSVTDPGGYCRGHESSEQFAVTDRRSPSEVVAAIMAAGYDPVWKDWDATLTGGAAR